MALRTGAVQPVFSRPDYKSLIPLLQFHATSRHHRHAVDTLAFVTDEMGVLIINGRFVPIVMQGIQPFSILRCYFVDKAALDECVKRPVQRHLVQMCVMNPGKDVTVRQSCLRPDEDVQDTQPGRSHLEPEVMQYVFPM